MNHDSGVVMRRAGLVPSVREFMEDGDSKMLAIRKSETLHGIVASGGLEEAIRAGVVKSEQVRRYLLDGKYSEALTRITETLAAGLVGVGYEKAMKGDNDMIKFILPALDHRFDAGIRKQQVANAGSLANTLMTRLNEMPELTGSPFELEKVELEVSNFSSLGPKDKEEI